MNYDFLVELADGTFVRKSSEELQADDRVVFDGPDAFSSSRAAQRKLEEEINAAGGLEAWKAIGEPSAP